ncbi:MAG TPA: glycosyltransferase family A protein [Leptolyngbyaceae cyanobacterium]
MTPLVSIIIPCYNAEFWIAETLQSALSQTWQSKEIIVVDDGSTDKSLAIIRKFNSPQVKVIVQKNIGASSARNRALKEAQGDFIQYLDADDLLAPDKIERQVQLLKNGNSDCVAAGEWARFLNSPKEAKILPQAVWNDMLPVDWLICSWKGGGMMPIHAWLVPHTIAQKAGIWNEQLSLNDDGEYFFRVVLASQGVKFCPGAKSYYRSEVKGSLSRKMSPSALASAFLSIELCTQHLLAREDSYRIRHSCAAAYQRFIYLAYPDVPELVQKAEAQVKLLGGSDFPIEGSRMLQFFSMILGWKVVKQIQKVIY